MGRCILHVGHPKTGSTYLQTVLHLNEEALQQAGFWIPSDFRQFDWYHCGGLAERGANFSGNMQAVFEASEARQPERVDALLHHILYSGAENLILSSELLFYYISWSGTSLAVPRWPAIRCWSLPTWRGRIGPRYRTTFRTFAITDITALSWHSWRASGTRATCSTQRFSRVTIWTLPAARW